MLFFTDLKPGESAVTAAAAVALWMALWWMTEAVPLAVTALLPLVLFPILGVMDGKAVSAVYFNHVVFLFIGGFLVALAMQKWDLHKRIALRILMVFGGSAGFLLFGFMLTTAFLSMWISNTATAMMMVPIVLAISQNLELEYGEKHMKRFSIGLLLGIAYSASIGGVATLIGTPPNLSFARIYAISFPDAAEISFANWMIFASPAVIVLFACAWLVLFIQFIPKGGKIKLNRRYFKEQYLALGKVSYEQKVVFIAFIGMAMLWMFRADISVGQLTIPGWSRLFLFPQYLNDGTVAILIASLLFVIPSREKPEQKILTNDIFQKMPWHIILLFGGGFALATGFTESGLSSYLADNLTGLQSFDLSVIIACIALLTTFLTELSSNTATIEMLLPVLAAMSQAIGVHPLLLMVPATLSASFAFMLPVATPPNAIIFASKKVRVADMVKAGFLLNLVGAVIVTIVVYFWSAGAFGV